MPNCLNLGIRKSFNCLIQVKFYLKKEYSLRSSRRFINEIVRTFRHFSLSAFTRASPWAHWKIRVYSTPRFSAELHTPTLTISENNAQLFVISTTEKFSILTIFCSIVCTPLFTRVGNRLF